METKEYVAGFLFSKCGDIVALIEKQKPSWQKDKLNGVGGKIEPGETPLQAMQREFKEEAGLEITGWQPFCTLTGNDLSYNETGSNFKVHFFSSFSDKIYEVKSATEEKVEYYSVLVLNELPLIPNLAWLIPMALEKTLTAQVVEKIK